LADRPSGPRIIGDFGVSFLSQLALGKLAARDDKGEGGQIGWTEEKPQIPFDFAQDGLSIALRFGSMAGRDRRMTALFEVKDFTRKKE
jgi:hypothetical protein